MKFIVVLGVLFCSGMIGFGFANTYKMKRLFYFEVIDMINKLQNNINFSNKKIREILNDLNYKSDLNIFINSFIKYIDDREDYKGKIESVSFINEEEKTNIINFFECLGKYNASTQITELENYKKIFEDNYEVVKLKERKYYPLNIKLGIIVGACISLLII